MASPTDYLPSPDTAERRSHFLYRWGHSAKVKKLYGGAAEVARAGSAAWDKAKESSVVSVKTDDDQFLVF